MDYKFKVGQKVRVISERKEHWNDDGEMDVYFGRVVTISKILPENTGFHYFINTSSIYGGTWFWKESDFINIEKCIFSNDLNNGV